MKIAGGDIQRTKIQLRELEVHCICSCEGVSFFLFKALLETVSKFLEICSDLLQIPSPSCKELITVPYKVRYILVFWV